MLEGVEGYSCGKSVLVFLYLAIMSEDNTADSAAINATILTDTSSYLNQRIERRIDIW